MSKIHTTIGIYPNGHCKVNGVKAEHLEQHIEHNRTFRPGRALMVDGIIVLNGYGSGNQTDQEYLNRMKEIKKTECTVPYI